MAKFEKIIIENDENLLIKKFISLFKQKIRKKKKGRFSFVLTGGEIPAMSAINGILRLIPGTLGSMESLKDESHNGFLLEHPHYTRPADFKGLKVPNVLLSGNHEKINKWRMKERRQRTKNKRPDIWSKRIEKLESLEDK